MNLTLEVREERGRSRGVVFDIQRYSIHDGPGIRTTIFVKGCPLRCEWCSNPESQNLHPEILVREEKCDRCGKCLDVCLLEAIVLNEDGLQMDRSICNRCMKCADVCLTDALSRTGKNMDVEEIVEEARKDEPFYRNSGGGVTISGGEPLHQWEFTLDILKGCMEKGLHTALDTCGYARWEIFNKILKCTDLVLYDIKHLNPQIHRELTGFGNDLILKNLKKTSEIEKRIWIRIPVIPGYSDSRGYIRELAEFLSEIRFEKVSLLAYHKWGMGKYKALGRQYPLNDLSSLEEDELYPLRDILESRGMEVTIGY